MEHEQQHPTGPTFDTLKAAQALKDAGFSDMQAKAVTHTIVEAQDNLASKADIRELRAEMMGEFKAQRADNKRVLDAFEAHVKVLRAENQRMEETLRADNKRVLDAFEAHIKVLRADNMRMEEGLRADFKGLRTEMKSLKDSVESLKSLVMYVILPLVMGAVLISLTVFGFVMTRIPPG